MRSILKVLPFIVFSLTAAADTILFTNGPDEGTGGWYLSTPGASSQMFTLTAGGTVDSMTFSSWTTGGGPSSVDWIISTGAEGAGQLDSGTSSVSDAFNFTSGIYNIYNSQASLPAVQLTAGTYWLTLDTNNSSDGSEVYWGSNAPVAGAYSCANNCSPGGSGWIDISASYNLTLELDGTASTTPEPGTLALLGAGFTGLATLRRRKKQA